MEVVINNQKKVFTKEEIALQEILDIEMPYKQSGVAVAINNIVIPKTEWINKAINNNDNLLIIKATQGG